MSTGFNKPASITEILKQSTDSCSVLLSKISQIHELQNKLRNHVGRPLSEHLNVANYSDDSLTLHTDSPAWASRLRFKIQTILEYARTECGLENLKSVRVKVVLMNPNIDRTRPAPRVSKQTANLIEDTAKSIDDQDLKSALIKLSKHLL